MNAVSHNDIFGFENPRLKKKIKSPFRWLSFKANTKYSKGLDKISPEKKRARGLEKLDAALTPGTAESLNRFIRNVQNGGVTPEMDKLAPIVPPAIQPAIQPARQHLGQHLGQPPQYAPLIQYDPPESQELFDADIDAELARHDEDLAAAALEAQAEACARKAEEEEEELAWIQEQAEEFARDQAQGLV